VRWVLTRELDDARPLAEELGLEVVPCIERVDLPWPPWPKSPLVFVTSAHVARRLCRMTAPPGTRVAALRPVTAAMLPRADVTAEGGAVALANAVKEWAAGKPRLAVLYLTSDKGFRQPEQLDAVRVLETVGDVYRHALYSNRAPEGLSGALAKHRGEGFVFFSPSAVEHFIAAGGEASRVICVGQSTARAWLGPAPLLATPETVKKVLKEQLDTP